MNELQIFNVSVPLRGLHFSNSFCQTFKESSVPDSFRPLAGTAFLKLCTNCNARKYFKIVSVPLRGLHFSNYFEGNMTFWHATVSVPLRGLHFSNTIPGTLCFSWGYFAFCVGKIILRNTAFWNHKKPHNLQYFCGARKNQEIKISHCPIIYSFPL